MSLRRQGALALWGLYLASGCSLVSSYPNASAEESPAACSNGLDDDLDGRSDCKDQGCANFCREADATLCQDGIDNDNDELADCADPSCDANGGCSEDTDARCSDLRDNDGDGATDCEDSSCDGDRGCSEDTDAACDDLRDNDDDGLTDCEDASCDGFCIEMGADACSDGRDNDGDDDSDCNDPGCDGHCPEAEPGPCGDGRDNDGDGLTDASDPLCWPLFPPAVRRCATTAYQQVVVLFDATDDFHTFGLNAFVGYPPRVPSTRSDGALSMAGSTVAGALESGNLSGAVVGRVLSGAWDRFELSFGAVVLTHTKLEVALLPAELAPEGRAPAAGADAALVAVTLDGSVNPPVFSLDVGGRRSEQELPFPGTCEGGYCDAGWGRVTVSLEGEELVARVSVADVDDQTRDAEVTVRAPVGTELPPSRLVIWGGSANTYVAAALDDLVFHHAAHSPCGVPVPQIPSRDQACAADDANRGSTGHTVSIARSAADGAFCALASAGAEAAGDPSSVVAWRSEDGTSFRSEGDGDGPVELAVPESMPVVGAAVARSEDDSEWLAVVAYREPTGVRLAFSRSEDCTRWAELAEGPLLPADAEPPSYVAAGGEHRIYFTRPASEETLRTLWRASGAEQDVVAAEDFPLFELSTELRATPPFAIQRVGASDLVMTYPTLAFEGSVGGGALVGDASGTTFAPLHSALISPPSPFETSFDSDGVAALSFAWWEGVEAGEGLLLYGGLHTETTLNGESSLRITTGTALAAPEGVTPLVVPATEPGRCGDGDCEKETCQSCPEDCDCDGRVLIPEPGVEDALHDASAWQFFAGYGSSSYIDESNGWLHLLPLAEEPEDYAGAALPLGAPVLGDFELSFDLLAARSCGRLLVGLRDPTTPMGPPFVSNHAQVTSCSPTTIELTPAVYSPGQEFGAKLACEGSGVHGAPGDTPLRVVLRKRAGEVRVSVVSDDACFDPVVTPAFSTDNLTDLIVAMLGTCADTRPTSIGNVRLRLLEDPDDCPADETRCEEGTAAGCVDTSTSLEHCGGCFQPCGAQATCVAGECRCPEGLTYCEEPMLAGGRDARCVATDASITHCGACGASCDAACVGGECVGHSCAEAAVIPATGGSFEFTFHPTLTPDDPVPHCAEQMQGEAAFVWTPEASGTARLALQSDWHAVLAVTTAEDCASYDECIVADDTGAAEFEFAVTAGTTYRILVGNPSFRAVTVDHLIVELE